MAENINDLTMAFYQDDRNVVKELDKIVLTRGSWTTIMYKFQELNKKTEEYGAPKISIRRYQKRSGLYKQQSKFNISSGKQANEIAGILKHWFPETEEEETKRVEKVAKYIAEAAELSKAREAAESAMAQVDMLPEGMEPPPED